MTHPSNFHGPPPVSPRPEPRGSRVVEVPAQRVPTPARLSLTVNARGRVYLSRELSAHLSLSAGQPIDLLAPTRYHSRGLWHLDLRPTALRRLIVEEGFRARIHRVATDDFPAHMATLTLYLLSAPPEHPGYYPLTPHANPPQQQR